MTQEEANAEIDKFISKIRIAESNETYVVMTPAEAKRLLQSLHPSAPPIKEINL